MSQGQSNNWLLIGLATAGLAVLTVIVLVTFYLGYLESILGSAALSPSANPVNDANAMTEAFGHRGANSSGTADKMVSIVTPFFGKGNRVAQSVYAQFPGKEKGPACLVLLRLSTPSDSALISDAGTADNVSHTYMGFPPRGDAKTWWLRYSIHNRSFEEKLTLGETEYKLAAGRVFTVDLRTNPVTVQQLHDDPAEYLPATDPTREDFLRATTTLQANHPAVKTLWESP